MKKRKNINVFAVGVPIAACLIIVCIVALILHNDTLIGKSHKSTITASVRQGTVIPAWYTPQKLKATTVTYYTNNITPTTFNGNLSGTPRILPIADKANNSDTSTADSSSATVSENSSVTTSSSSSDNTSDSSSSSVSAYSSSSDLSSSSADTSSASGSTVSGSENTTASDNIAVNLYKFNVTYYANPNTSQIIEPFSFIRGKMHLSDDTYIYLMDYGPMYTYGPKNWDYIYYYTYNLDMGVMTNVTAFRMNVSTGEYQKLPSQIDWTLSFISVTDDDKYISVDEIPNTNNYQCDEVYVIDTEDMSVKMITNENVGCSPEISPDSKYLFYNTTDRVNGTNDQPKMGHFYNFETGQDIQSPVEIDDRGNANSLDIALKYGSKFTADQFFNDDKYYIGISTKDHITPIIVETATGNQVPDSVAADSIGRYSVGKDFTNEFSNTVDDTNLYRFDYLSGDQPIIAQNATDNFSSDNSVFWTVSTDGKYVYTYQIGDDFIKCINVMTLQSFDIDISKDFTSQIAELATQGIYACDYRLQISSDDTQVMLNFVLSNVSDPTGFNSSNDPNNPQFSSQFPPISHAVSAPTQSEQGSSEHIQSTQRKVTMPDLTGMKLDEAEALINQIGLNVGAISYESSDKPDRTVISQKISAGSSVDTGTYVDLAASSGSLDDTSKP